MCLVGSHEVSLRSNETIRKCLLHLADWCLPQIHVHLGPHKVTLFGQRVFADVIGRDAVELGGPCIQRLVSLQEEKGHRDTEGAR